MTTEPSSPAVGVDVALWIRRSRLPTARLTLLESPDSLRSTQPGRGRRQLDHFVRRWLAPDHDRRPLELRIMSSDATVPPQIVSTQGKPDGIVLTFNKPMNLVEASNVNNYALSWTTTHFKFDDLGPVALFGARRGRMAPVPPRDPCGSNPHNTIPRPIR